METGQELKQGIKEALPIVVGYVPLGLAFGMLAKDAGLSVPEATFMSAMCFTGAGQYIAIGIIAASGSWLAIILANLLVNLRYTLFSTSLVPHLKNLPAGIASLLMLGLTDETYAVSVVHYGKKEATVPYILGLNTTSYASWVFSTLAGAALGSFIKNTEALGLNFALPAMYTILLVLVIKSKSHLAVALASVAICLAISLAFPATLKNLSSIIIAAVAAATLGVIIRAK